MRILFLSWRDPKNSKSGGAEIFSKEVLSRFGEKGHGITWFASTSGKLKEKEQIEGISIIRRGNIITVLFFAFLHYLKHRDEYDVVIDNFHAYPYLSAFYVPKSKRVAMIHEVAGKEIWKKMIKLPFSSIGRIIEYYLLRVFYNKDRFITVSKSTKDELSTFGINEKNIFIVQNGIDFKPLKDLPKKSYDPTLIYFAGLREVKRVEEIIRAMVHIKAEFPKWKLSILGRHEGKYYQKLKDLVWELKLERNIHFVGFLSDLVKKELIKQSWVNLGTSIKEGWGLVVTESQALGTPSVVYDVPGYKDSVKHYRTGLITIKNTPLYLAKAVKRLVLDKQLYTKLQKNGIREARKYTWEKSAQAFEKIIYKAFPFREIDLLRQEKVSVIIPTFNSAKFLEKTLQSVKDQTYKNIEMIVVDGGSTDKTLSIAKKFGSRVYTTKKGRSAQKNKGANKAKGKLIYFIDSDFVLHSNVLKSAVQQLREKSLDMIAIHNSSDPEVSFWSKVRKFERDFFKYDTHNISPRFLTKKAFENVDGFNENLIAGEDYDIYNRLLASGAKLGFISEGEMHLGEPRSLNEVIQKHFFYGETLGAEKQGEKPNLTLAQVSPLRPAYFKKLYRFIIKPHLTVGLIVYNSVRFASGAAGYIANKLKREEVTDKHFI